MNTKSSLAVAAVLLAAAMGSAANAATYYSYVGPTGPLPTDTTVSAVFNAPGGAATASFIIDGYASLDGQNWYEDDFSLSLNGTSILTGTFNLGGGGYNVVYTNPDGATVDFDLANGTDVTWNGGQVTISTPISLLNGSNQMDFTYTSLSDGYAGFQGTGDEAWGLEQITVSGAAVPEPSTWAMMLIGVGGLGGALRTRRRLAVATA